MATWAKCPDLFLYTKRKDVYLWRCNETTTTWMPMKTADFNDLGKVTDHVDLIGGKDSILEWEESSYNDLVAYISSRRLLVNSRGLVIAELHEFDQDGKMEENGLPFYIRSLDVLSLKPFGLRNRTIPSRMVMYLETEGEAASVEEDSNTTTTTTTELDEGNRRADFEKQVAELKAANKTLKSDMEALKSGKEAAEQQANDLKDRNKSLAKDVEAQRTAAEKAQQERDAAERDKEALKIDKEAAERDKEAAERKAADLQTQIDSLVPINNEKKEVWMNEYSDQLGNWKTFDDLKKEIYHILIHHPTYRGDYGTVDLSTNVLPSYMHVGLLVDAKNNMLGSKGFRAIRLNDLNPNKERARFDFMEWYRGTFNGDMYAIKENPTSLLRRVPLVASQLSEEEVKSLNLLGS